MPPAFWLFTTLWLGGVLFFLLVWNSLPILFFPDTAGFVLERPNVPATWLPILQVHILGGIGCLLSGVALLLPRMIPPRHHRMIGWVYVLSGAGISLPTGLWLAGHANGGPVGVAGFRFTALWLGVATAMGHHYYRKEDWVSHGRWMLRSYGAAAAALTFRLVYVSGIRLGFPYELNYPFSTWAAVLLNGMAVEIFLFRSSPPDTFPVCHSGGSA